MARFAERPRSVDPGGRRRRLAGLALAAVLWLAVSPAEASGDPPYAGWFHVGQEVTATWLVRGVAGDPYHVVIRRRSPDPRAAEKRVIVFYPRPSSAYDTAMTKILEVFADKNVGAVFDVFNFRKDGARGRELLAWAEKQGIGLIFSMGSESTAWLYANYLGGAIPVVSVCSKDPVVLGQARDYDVGSGSNFAFTSLNMPIEAQMAYVHELKPRLKNIGLLVDAKNVSAVQTQAKPMVEFARQRGLRILYLAVENPANARAELSRLVPEAVTAMRKNDPDLDNSIFWITGSTAVFREIATINAFADRVPVVSVAPELVRPGADSTVLSVGISFQSNAHLAAVYGADVLAGRVAAGDLPVGVVSPPDIAINFLKAREIGLRIPFSFIESASFIYDYEGRQVRANGKSLAQTD